MRPLTDAELEKMERDTIRSATGDDGWPTDKVGWVPMLMLSSACGEIRALRAERAETVLLLQGLSGLTPDFHLADHVRRIEKYLDHLAIDIRAIVEEEKKGT